MQTRKRQQTSNVITKLICVVAVFLCSFQLIGDKQYVSIQFEKDEQLMALSKDNFKLIVTKMDGTNIPLQWEGTKFEVPDFEGNDFVNITFSYGKTVLEFPKMSVTKFQSNWIIGIDKKPFNKEVLEITNVPRKIKYYYYIKFSHGTMCLVQIERRKLW